MKKMTFLTMGILLGKLTHLIAFILFYRAYEASLALPIYWALSAAIVSAGAFLLAIIIPWKILHQLAVGTMLFLALFLVAFHLIVLIQEVLASPIEWWEWHLILTTFPETVVFLFIPLMDVTFAVTLWYRSQWIHRELCPENMAWCRQTDV